MKTPRFNRAALALLAPVALFAAGCGDDNTVAAPTADTTPPAVPSGLHLSSLYDHLQLDWTANSEPDLAGYVVVQSTDAGATWNDVTASAVTATTLDVPKSQQVQFRVSAIDNSSNQSAYSSPASYRAPNSQPKFPVVEASVR